jgi:hypothetical protein
MKYLESPRTLRHFWLPQGTVDHSQPKQPRFAEALC